MHNPSILFVVECFIKINQLIFKENNKWQVENQVTSFLMNPLDSTDWREIHNDGTLKYRFELIEQNNDTVTLFDFKLIHIVIVKLLVKYLPGGTIKYPLFISIAESLLLNLSLTNEIFISP